MGDINLEKIISYLIALGFGTIYQQARKLLRDIDASFKKIREIEYRLIRLEEAENGRDFRE